MKSQLQTLGRKQSGTKRLENKSKDVKVLRDAVRKHPEAVKDQQEYWCAKTGKSRASFYRVLARSGKGSPLPSVSLAGDTD